jgi:hypothetical protein
VTRLILTSSSGMALAMTDRADVVIPFHFRFVWGAPPSAAELAFYLAAQSPNHGPGERWSNQRSPVAPEAGADEAMSK